MKEIDQSVLSEERTLLANERTLLAYIRTFFSATILAVVLFKFFDDKASQQLGLVVIFIGLSFLVVGVSYYVSRRRKLANKTRNKFK